jgi:hypothetical protein
MTREAQPVTEIADEDVFSLLSRALRKTLILGILAALILWIASTWRNAAMMATGTAVSSLGILEWGRLVRIIKAKLDRNQMPRGAAVAIVFFLLRLVVFAALIYGSLKCFHGSVAALFFGVALAPLTIAFEAVRLLRE